MCLLLRIRAYILASIEEASRNAGDKYEEDRVHLLNANEALEVEVQELQSKLSQER
jgi:hypothetical protein